MVKKKNPVQNAEAKLAGETQWKFCCKWTDMIIKDWLNWTDMSGQAWPESEQLVWVDRHDKRLNKLNWHEWTDTARWLNWNARIHDKWVTKLKWHEQTDNLWVNKLKWHEWTHTRSNREWLNWHQWAHIMIVRVNKTELIWDSGNDQTTFSSNTGSNQTTSMTWS